MIFIGALLIYLAIAKKMEPALLLPMGFGAILVNIPGSGAAGISAFPMSARVVHKMGQAEDSQNFLLMHAVSANVAGQIFSAIIGGLIIGLV